MPEPAAHTAAQITLVFPFSGMSHNPKHTFQNDWILITVAVLLYPLHQIVVENALTHDCLGIRNGYSVTHTVCTKENAQQSLTK